MKLAKQRQVETDGEHKDLLQKVKDVQAEKKHLNDVIKEKNAKIENLTKKMGKIQKKMKTNDRSLEKKQHALDAKAGKQQKARKKKIEHQLKTQEAALASLQSELDRNEKLFHKQADKINKLERSLLDLKREQGQKLTADDISVTTPTSAGQRSSSIGRESQPIIYKSHTTRSRSRKNSATELDVPANRPSIKS
eukprot:UN26229